MKKTIATALLALTLATASGCTESTKFGDCVGIDSADRDPKLRYKLDIGNVILATIFFEMIFPPILVVLNEAYCPVGRQ